MKLYLVYFSIGTFITWCDEKLIDSAFKKFCIEYRYSEMNQIQIDYYHEYVVDALFHKNTLIYIKGT